MSGVVYESYTINKPAATDRAWTILNFCGEGKLSKEAALDLLEKRAEIFGDDGGTQAAGAHGSRQSRVEKDKAIFLSLGNKRYPG